MNRFTLLFVLLLSAATSVAAEQIIVVDSVIAGSAAEAAGIESGDRLLRLAGREIVTQEDLTEIIESHAPGDEVVLTVLREEEPVDLSLTFGERPDGGVSIGVRLAIETAGGGPGPGTAWCLDWIERTYRVDGLSEQLLPALEQDREAMKACVTRDTGGLSLERAELFCENIFKVHCNGVSLLAEIGEAMIGECERQLEKSFGVVPTQHKAWTSCARDNLLDRYATGGGRIDRGSCRSELLDECGKNIGALVGAGSVSSERRQFVDCCAGESFEAAGGTCSMIDESFTRGPCRDHPICVNRDTGEWLDCSALR